jgi:hypothetical protein
MAVIDYLSPVSFDDVVNVYNERNLLREQELK